MVLIRILTFDTTVLQAFLFYTTWILFIAGLFVATRLLLSAHFCSVARNLIAFGISSSLIFQLAMLHNESAATRKMILDKGPPLNCLGLSWLTSLLSAYSCPEYYETLQGNIFWQLNVLRVSGTLLKDMVILTASMCGGALGEFVHSFINKFHWLIYVPVLIGTLLCVLSSIFALFGCRFDLIYGLIRVDFRNQRILRCVNCVSNENFGEASKRKFLACTRKETKPLLLINELYQKALNRRKIKL
ncbi:unnamed protein product [Thelazia callipaeda]|uniref:Uncharacterized protein n=1 Tax=Thelazia callipaeda TaxID=103827 RepID=A0A0N5D870_THECL|nr:unnamed protein product [Thelazia callipaeda]